MKPPRNACSHPLRNVRLRTTIKGEMRLCPAPKPRIQGISRKEWRAAAKVMKGSQKWLGASFQKG